MDIRTENCNLKTGEKVVEEMLRKYMQIFENLFEVLCLKF